MSTNVPKKACKFSVALHSGDNHQVARRSSCRQAETAAAAAAHTRELHQGHFLCPIIEVIINEAVFFPMP
jgi:hypothetical protein